MKKGILVHGENFFKIFICAKGVAGAGRRREDQLRRGAANSVILTNGDGACDRRSILSTSQRQFAPCSFGNIQADPRTSSYLRNASRGVSPLWKHVSGKAGSPFIVVLEQNHNGSMKHDRLEQIEISSID